jgi:hypothetical protein
MRFVAFAVILLAAGCDPRSAGGPNGKGGSPTSKASVRVFDMSDRTAKHIGWPTSWRDSIWVLERPGPVRLIMPEGHELSGEPMVLEFSRDTMTGFLFCSEAENIYDAYARGLEYSKLFGLPTEPMETWRKLGGGSQVKGTGNFGGWCGTLQVNIDLRYLGPPGKDFIVYLSVGWPVDPKDSRAPKRPMLKSAATRDGPATRPLEGKGVIPQGEGKGVIPEGGKRAGKGVIPERRA